jgi:hypothetical protein
MHSSRRERKRKTSVGGDGKGCRRDRIQQSFFAFHIFFRQRCEEADGLGKRRGERGNCRLQREGERAREWNREKWRSSHV